MTTRSPRLSRDAILDTARAMIVAQGIGAFSLRGLAARLGVTAPSLYRFFDSKDAIVASIADAEFALLIDAIERAADAEVDPVEQIKMQSTAYVECAVASPALFAVMFAYRPPWLEDPGPAELPLASKAWKLASSAVEAAIAQGSLRESDPVLASLTIWSAVHGVATLLTVGDPAAEQTIDRALATSVIDAVVDGLAVRDSGP
ncbi:MAG: TetR/AcrR family transcriptional regulator [Actinobacteria bacterium]|nr:TetR/AcrR family transcriptional regulator [Actinomycetota bacterium]